MIRRIITICVLTTIFLFLRLEYVSVYPQGEPTVRELPFDMIYTDAPGENYIVFGTTTVYAKFLRGFKKSELSAESRKMRSDLLYKFDKNVLEPAINERNLSDHIFTLVINSFDPPIILVGIYDPTPDKVEFIVSLLNRYKKDYYNYTYILFRMLRPLSWVEKYNELISSKGQLIINMAREIFQNASDLRVYASIDITMGLGIIILEPNPSIEQVRNWIASVREVIPEEIPIIFYFVREFPVVDYEVGHTYSILGNQYEINSKMLDENDLLLFIIGSIIVLVLFTLGKGYLPRVFCR